MKRVFMPLCAIALLSVVSCNQSSTTEAGADSTSTTTTTTSTDAATGSTAAPSAATTTVDENASYVDLKSGKTIKVKKNQETGKYINSETNEPLMYYVNPSTADTFDVQGRVVNNALVKGPEGYTVDETKITTDNGKLKTQSDGDVKAKEGDVKAKVETDGDMKLKSGDSKEKIKDDTYKSKDASGKTKTTDEGKTKSKS
jgi:hypothetical protein